MPRAGTPAPFLVALDHLAFPPNLPAGLSPWMLIAIGHERRNSGAQVRDPITVRRHPTWPEGWRQAPGRRIHSRRLRVNPGRGGGAPLKLLFAAVLTFTVAGILYCTALGLLHR